MDNKKNILSQVDAGYFINSKKLIFAVVVNFFSLLGYASVGDTATLRSINNRGEAIYSSKPDSALILFKDAESYSNKLLLNAKNSALIFEIKKQKALAINNQGIMLFDGNVNEALELFLRALKIREEINDKENLSESYNNLATIYNSLGKYDIALLYAYKSLSFDEKYNTKHLGYSYNSIGAIYYDFKDAENSLKFYMKSLEVREKYGDLGQIAISCNNVSNAYILTADYSTSEKYIKRAINIWETKKDLRALSTAYMNYGAIFQKVHKPDSAIYYALKSLAIREKMKDQTGLSSSYNNVARMYFELKEFDKAEENGIKAFVLAEKVKSPMDIQNAAEVLKKVYEMKKDDASSYKYYKRYIEMRDSIQNREYQKLAYKTQVKFEFDKKEALTQAELAKRELMLLKNKQSLIFLEQENQLKELSLSKSSIELLSQKNETKAQQKTIEVLNKDKALKSEEAKRNALELEKQRVLTMAALGVGVLFLAFLLVSIRGYRQKKKANEVIALQKLIVEEKHREIKDSINYAERIQRSFLASNEMLLRHLKDYFIFFMPKDIVSGDFYWATILKNGNFAYATADSTGHGVPGAIMSILNVTSLEKAVEFHSEPSAILNHTRKNIIDRLREDGSADGGKDGMDCSLVSINFKELKLTYSAANNPVWILRTANSATNLIEILELPADKMPVGKHDKDSISFEQRSILLQKGDVVYTFTDGYADQFGGPKGKKFKYKQLQEILIANVHESMPRQREILANTIEEWKGSLEQIDDILIMGIRV